MDVKIFSIYDKVASVYGEPFTAPRDEVAVRKFNYFMSNAPMVASDCDLYCLGTYNVDSGIILAYDKPMFILRYEVKE